MTLLKLNAAALAVCGALFLSVSLGSEEIGNPAPEISGQSWINSKSLTLAELKGKVVLLEFWTFGCVNCRNIEPYVKAWHKQYADQGLVVVAVHAPEFSYERSLANVQRYVRERGITYPVAIDNDFATWNRYKNRYWPALYLIDKRGIVRYLRIGEGGYPQTEQWIVKLLAERANP